jgi:hypothetical protein
VSARTPTNLSPPTKSPPIQSRMSEDDLLRCVLDLARVMGWRTLHIRPARTEKGYRTPLQGDGAGWPDLLMVRVDRMVIAELKSDKGSTTLAQEQWLEALSHAIDRRTYVWRPADWHSGEILRVLSS